MRVASAVFALLVLLATEPWQRQLRVNLKGHGGQTRLTRTQKCALRHRGHRSQPSIGARS
jgi:hypothetical protein